MRRKVSNSVVILGGGRPYSCPHTCSNHRDLVDRYPMPSCREGSSPRCANRVANNRRTALCLADGIHPPEFSAGPFGMVFVGRCSNPTLLNQTSRTHRGGGT